jgi:hypothetical protein
LRYLGVAPTEPLLAKGKPADKPRAKTAEAEPDRPGLDEPAAIVAADQGAADEGLEREPDDEPGDAVPGTDGLIALPDFTGLGMGSVIRAAHRAGVEVVPTGSGLAVGQTPPPGMVPTGTVCRVSFAHAGG